MPRYARLAEDGADLPTLTTTSQGAAQMSPTPPPTANKPLTLTVELSNTRTDRGRRLRNRTETYVLGHAPCYDPFSFCCYRALLLGAVGACIRKLVMICYGVLKNRQPFDPGWAS